jgi:hypothetical protein
MATSNPGINKGWEKRVCYELAKGVKTTLLCKMSDLYFISFFKFSWLLYIPLGLRFGESTFCPQSVCLFGTDLRADSDYSPTQHQLNGFYNWEGFCLLRGTDRIFIYNSGNFSLWKGHAIYPAVIRRAFRRGGPVSIPGVSIWVVWRTNWQWDRVFFPSNVFFPSQYHSISAVYSFPCTYLYYPKD